MQAQASMTMQTLEDQVGGDPVKQFTPPRTGKSFTDQVMDRVADASNIDVFSLDWGSMPVEFRGMKLLGASTSGTSHEERPEPTSRALRVLQVFPRACQSRGAELYRGQVTAEHGQRPYEVHQQVRLDRGQKLWGTEVFLLCAIR